MANYVNMSTNSTVTIGGDKNHVTIRGITINKLGATANTLTLTDSTTGAAIAVIDTTLAGIGFRDFFGMRVAGGLKAVMATGTAADVTILYD